MNLLERIVCHASTAIATALPHQYMLLKKRTSALTGSVQNPNQKRREALESSWHKQDNKKAILQSSIDHISLVYLFMNY